MRSTPVPSSRRGSANGPAPHPVHAAAAQEASEEETITQALGILASRLRCRPAFPTSGSVKTFLQLQSQGLQRETFGAMFLDAQHRLIAYERLFHGTLAEVSVHPRELARNALAHNAAAVILHHNHPSGCCDPSCHDADLTRELRAALRLIGVRVLDHIITSDECTLSMAESGHH